jgi:hypothetical protein
MPAVEAIVWKLLNKEVSVHFGTECAAVATWTVIVMVIRFVLQLAKIIDYVPVGLIFAFPLIIQVSYDLIVFVRISCLIADANRPFPSFYQP